MRAPARRLPPAALFPPRHFLLRLHRTHRSVPGKLPPPIPPGTCRPPLQPCPPDWRTYSRPGPNRLLQRALPAPDHGFRRFLPSLPENFLSRPPSRLKLPLRPDRPRTHPWPGPKRHRRLRRRTAAPEPTATGPVSSFSFSWLTFVTSFSAFSFRPCRRFS